MSTDETYVASPSQTAGPFFHHGLPAVAPARGGAHINLTIRVTDGIAAPVSDALIELWYAAADPPAAETPAPFATFARASTDTDGRCELTLPALARTSYSRPVTMAPHINVCLFARGLLRQVHTRIYFDGDAEVGQDPLLALVPTERRHTLLARRDPSRSEYWVFEVRLQGADETVFFAI